MQLLMNLKKKFNSFKQLTDGAKNFWPFVFGKLEKKKKKKR